MHEVVLEFSAGGVVIDDCRVLLIRTRTRRGRSVWTFPKGRLEQGEGNREAALREVREETGYACALKHDLGTTTYWFRRGAKKVKKTVHWYLLEALRKEGRFNPVEVDEVRWIDLHEAYGKLAHRGDRKLLARVEEETGCA